MLWTNIDLLFIKQLYLNSVLRMKCKMVMNTEEGLEDDGRG
jgi:hypothetical protein